jgi:hypothetical protein
LPGNGSANWLYLRVDSTGAVLDTIGAFQASSAAEVPVRRFDFLSPRPFTSGGNVGSAGAKVVVVNGAAYAAYIFTTDGRLERIVRLGRDRRPVTKHDVAAFLKYRRDSLPVLVHEAVGRGTLGGDVSMLTRQFEQKTDSLTFPDTMPAIAGLIVDDLGSLWLREYAPPHDSSRQQRWLVISPRGQWLGEVTMPPEESLLDVRGSSVLTHLVDDDGADRFAVYRLVKPR